MGQYCFAGWRLSSSVVHHHLSSSVMLPAGGPAGRLARGRSARRRPGVWAVRLPTHARRASRVTSRYGDTLFKSYWMHIYFKQYSFSDKMFRF